MSKMGQNTGTSKKPKSVMNNDATMARMLLCHIFISGRRREKGRNSSLDVGSSGPPSSPASGSMAGDKKPIKRLSRKICWSSRCA